MASTKKLTVNEALKKALEDATEPQKAKDIIDTALPLTSLSTKTPRATIAHALSVEARKDGGLFERTGPGMYRLREQKEEPAKKEESISPVTDELLAEAGKDRAAKEPEAKPDTKERQTRGSSTKKQTTAKRRGSRAAATAKS